ncbi:MAG: glycoside hydrolase family 172 protein [Planctomycetota bacterium]|jgi:hypothetical protein
MLDPADALPRCARLVDAETFSLSAENPDGRRGGGAQASPGDDPDCTPAARRLGRGWKVRPCLRDIDPGQTVVLADVEGPGTLRHMWFTVMPSLGRSLTLRVVYDDQPHPSVETPLGDFFANGLDGVARVTSLPVAVNPRGGMNAYWPMPFRRRLRIEVRNDGPRPVPELFYQLTGARHALPDDAAYLHATWRRSVTTRERPEHVILDGVEGRGQYVGTALVWAQRSAGWWGEGEVKFFIDDDADDAPTVCGTGTEDYFGGAWGFTCDGERDARPETYSGPFLGYPQAIFEATAAEGPRPPVHSLYRWHLPDPVHFRSRLRVTVQALGWWPDGTYQPLTDDIASTAFWYQAIPSAALRPLPPVEARW